MFHQCWVHVLSQFQLCFVGYLCLWLCLCSLYLLFWLHSVPSTFFSVPPTLCYVPSAMFCLCSIYRSVYILFVPVTALSALSTFDMIVGYVCWTYLSFWPSGEPRDSEKAKYGLEHYQTPSIHGHGPFLDYMSWPTIITLCNWSLILNMHHNAMKWPNGKYKAKSHKEWKLPVCDLIYVTSYVNGFLLFDKQQHLFLFFHSCWHWHPITHHLTQFLWPTHMFQQHCTVYKDITSSSSSSLHHIWMFCLI